MEKVVKVYHKQKQIEGNFHNSLTWSMYEEPLQKALELDKLKLKSKTPEAFRKNYPLSGFVISLKDSSYYKNSPSTSGMFLNLDRVATEDPDLFKKMKEKGAVFTCRGNIPQFLLSIESNNNLFGCTKNPLDPTRTGGGSTGGDAVNVKLGFANVAFGSDIAGSLRVPALHCGLYSLKPSDYRVSLSSMAYFFDRKFGSDRYPSEIKPHGSVQMILKIILGPIARSPRDIDKIMQVICSIQRPTSLTPPLKWNPKPEIKKRIGVFRGMKILEPCAATARAIDVCIERLSKQGYQFVEMDLDLFFQECIKWTIVSINKSPYILDILTKKTPIRENICLLYTSPSPRDLSTSRMPSSA